MPDRRSRPFPFAAPLSLVLLATVPATAQVGTVPPDAPTVGSNGAAGVAAGVAPVVARGWVEPASGVRRIAAETAGRIASVAVRPGDRVAAGQVVVLLETAMADARLQAADAIVAQREADVARPVPAAAGKRAAAEHAARAAKGREEEALELAKADRAAAAAALVRYRLPSPIAATVLQRLRDPGDVVTPGEPILVVGDLTSLRVRAEVEIDSLAGLVPGQVAEIAPAGPLGPRVAGRIVEIGQVVGRLPLPEGRTDARVDVQTVDVLVRLEAQPQLPLRPGQRVDVVFGAAAP